MNDAALAIRSPRAIEPWREPEWQRLWLAVRSRAWRSLAVLPAGPGAPEDFALRIAVMLSRTGMLHLGAPIQVADATRVPLSQLSPFIAEVQRCVSDNELILVAMAALSQNPVSLSLARSLDAALLCVGFEQMAMSDARKTVAHVGHERFVGTASFHPQ